MKRILKILLVGTIAAQCVYWIPRFARADAIEDGGAVYATALLCDIWPTEIAVEGLYERAKMEEGIEDLNVIGAMMRRQGKVVVMQYKTLLKDANQRREWCFEMKKFYMERGALGTEPEDAE